MTVDIPLSLRIPLGRPLTASEVDENFKALKAGIEEVAGAMGYVLYIGAEPALEDRPTAMWIPADRTGVFVWDSVAGKWALVDPTMYAIATNSGNAYAASLPANYASTLSELLGRTITLKVPAGNTDASTLNINGLGAVSIKRNGTQDLVSGNMLTGGVYQFLYDGTVFHLLNYALVLPAEKAAVWASSLFDAPDPGTAPIIIVHPLGSMPTQVRLVAVVKNGQATNAGWSVGQELEATVFGCDIDDSMPDTPLFTIASTAETISVVTHPTNKGVMYTDNEGKDVKPVWSVFKAAFSFKVYVSLEGQSSITIPTQNWEVASINERRTSGTNGTAIPVNATSTILLTYAYDPEPGILTAFNENTGVFQPKAGRYACTVIIPLAITGTAAQNNKQRLIIELWNVTDATQVYYITSSLYDDDLSERIVTFLPILDTQGNKEFSLRVRHEGSTGTAVAMVAGLAAAISGVEERFSEIQLIRLS